MFHLFDEIGSIIAKMECKLISRYMLLSVLFLASQVNARTGHKRNVDNSYWRFYFGQPTVEVGKPFSISCSISIEEHLEWHKDGEPIRHGEDEHSYSISGFRIPGAKTRMITTIRVQRALPKHEGRYKCNSLDTDSFELKVHRNSSSGTIGNSGGTSGSGGGESAGNHQTTDRKTVEPMLDKLDEPLVGPQPVVTIKPTLITSTESHYPLRTSGSVIPINVHPDPDTAKANIIDNDNVDILDSKHKENVVGAIH